LVTNKTALSYWFPKIEAAGVPVPRTKLLKMPVAAQEDVWALFDGKDGPDGGKAMKQFIAGVAAAAAEFGFPFFLRTDMTSGKHDWEHTCFVSSAASVLQCILNIVEFSECADMMGLPWDAWAVREFLPTMPLGVCPRYGNMPVCREFRFFVDGGKVTCVHPYWPRHALEQGGADMSDAEYGRLCECTVPEGIELCAMAEKAGRAVDGAWSVDILETRRGWFVTDMAEARKSFHWEGCQNGGKP